MGQALATYKFYTIGKKRFTETGWLKASANYPKPDVLNTIDLSDRIILVTGANSGIGKEMTRYFSSKNATVYMVCRNLQRGEAAKAEILKQYNNANLEVLVADVSLKQDVKQLVDTMSTKVEKIDALICNAGALLSKKTYTKEGKEVTFACHFLYGFKYLTELCIPLLEHSSDPRVVGVTSGGLYNTKLPSWEVLTGEKQGRYYGQMAYSYAKRAQIFQCRAWAKEFPTIKFVTAHPGWTKTPGIDDTFGSYQSFLKPLRSLWQGSEGICWCAVVNTEELENAALYLDRTVQEQHFTSGTKSKQKDIDEFYAKLDEARAEF